MEETTTEKPSVRTSRRNSLRRALVCAGLTYRHRKNRIEVMPVMTYNIYVVCNEALEWINDGQHAPNIVVTAALNALCDVVSKLRDGSNAYRDCEALRTIKARQEEVA